MTLMAAASDCVIHSGTRNESPCSFECLRMAVPLLSLGFELLLEFADGRSPAIHNAVGPRLGAFAVRMHALHECVAE